MTLYWPIIILCAAHCLIHFAESSAKYTLTGQIINCTVGSPQITYNVTCDIPKYNRTHYLWNNDLFLKPNVKLHNLYVKATMFRRPSANRPFESVRGLTNYTANVCALASGRQKSFFMNIFSEDIKKYSNFLEPCPRSGHIYTKNWIINLDRYPPVIPLGEYKIQAFIYTKKNNDELVIYQFNYFTNVISKN